MPRITKPQKQPAPPPDDELDDDGVVDVVDHQPDHVEEMISELIGDRQVVATVYRDTGDGESVVDSLPIRADQGMDDILKTISRRWGHGRYRLQLRELNRRGTLGNVRLPEIAKGAFGSPVSSDAAPPAPAAPNVHDLLMKQNDQLFGMVRDVLVKPPPATTPATSLQDQMAMLATMFKFSRSMGRAAAETEVPPWLETIGRVAAPVLSALMDNVGKPKNKPGAAPAQRRPVPNTAPPAPTTAAAVPSAPTTESPAADQDDDGDDQGDDASAVEIALEGILSAAAAEAAPDANVYAAIIWNVAAEEFAAIAKGSKPGMIAAGVMGQIPALKTKPEFCEKLETALRAKLAAADAPPPAQEPKP